MGYESTWHRKIKGGCRIIVVELQPDNEFMSRSIKIILNKWIKELEVAIKNDNISNVHGVKNEMMILRGDYDY